MIELCREYLSVWCIWLYATYYHVTYAFQSESTFYIYLNVKELISQNRCDVWSLSNSNGIRQLYSVNSLWNVDITW